jgi:SNF2 family DNA or RNA helicase
MSIKNLYAHDGYEFVFHHTSIAAIFREFYNICSLVELKKAVDEKKIPTILYTIYKENEPVQDAIDQLKKNGPIESGDTFLFKHQQLCRQIALLQPRYGFFLETGTGKTPMSLQIIADDLIQRPNNKWLVVCPLSLIHTAWIEDGTRFFPWMKIVNLHGSTAKKTKEAFNFKHGQIYVINYESFKLHYDELLAFDFAGVFVDESSKMKNPSSGITKALLKFAHAVPRWYELSGTPAPNTMLEYFAQMKAIDQNLLGKNFTSYKAKWFFQYSKGGFAAFDILPERKAELVEVIKQKAIFISKDDCFDLPERIYIKREIEMDSKLKKMYNQMKRDLFTTFEGQTITAATAVTALGKLNQLTSGILLNDGVPNRVDTSKLSELVEVLEEIGDKQAIVWANFREEFAMIKDKLGDECVTYYGGTTKDEVVNIAAKFYTPAQIENLLNQMSFKDLAVKLFKEGKVKYFVANPASAAYGLTLTNCSYAIYYGLNYSYEQFGQSKDRIYRYGQKNHCTYIYILMKGSIDYTLYKVLHDKQDLSKEVLNHLRPESIGGEE